MGLTKPRAGQINFDIHNVTDPLIRINSGQSGTNDKDVGFVFERGSDTNVGLIWDESADQFAFINTSETGTTSGNVTITSYANIRANEYHGDGSNLSGISTTTTLAALTDTTISSPADDEFLRYNGSAWINEAVTLTSTVAALTDTTISSPSSGQVLKYNGSAWINDADSATTTVTLSEMTGDGSDTTLTLEATPSSDDNLLVFVDSVLQDAGAWSRSGTTLTFSEAPANGAVVKAWDLLSSTATNAAKLDALTPNGSTTAFTLQQGGSNYTPSHANCLLVSIAGVMQEPGAGKAFTVSGSTITFSAAPATGATIWIVDVGGGVTVNTPADNTVTSAKIVDGAIVNADINASAAIAQSKVANVPYYTSSATAPTSPTPVAGDIWYDSANNQIKNWNGSEWLSMSNVVDTAGLEDDIAILGFKVAANGSLGKYDLIDQTIDDFQDATGVDASGSTNETRDASGKYYHGQATVTPSTSGGTLTTYTVDSTNYSVRTFTNDGNFVTDTALDADILVVGGGGTGAFIGSTSGGYGGGAGGFTYYSAKAVTAATHAVVVGDGGTASGGGSSPVDDHGDNSSFSGSLVAYGGQKGNGGSSGTYGSGGGGTSTYTPNQGNDGDSKGGGGAAEAGGTDGGGAGGDGYQEGTSTVYDWTQNDGSTVTFKVNGTGNYYAGGGSGGTAGAGGQGGGGTGVANGGPGGAGSANTGGGGGGADDGGGGMNRGGHGGSGIVIVRYPTSVSSAGNLTLVSNATTAEATPTTGDLVMTYTNGAGTATVNTDLKAYVSRDDGTTWTQATLSSEGTTGGHTILTAHNVDISSQPSGTSLRYKIETLNQSASKETRIQAVSLGWA